MTRLLARVLYWLAVIAISVALLVVLVRFFESRDEANVDGSAVPVRPITVA